MLGPVPADEHGDQHDRIQQARRDVRDAEPDVEDVGGHRPEYADADHGQPIRPCDVAAHAELQRQCGDEPDEPKHTATSGSIAWTR